MQMTRSASSPNRSLEDSNSHLHCTVVETLKIVVLSVILRNQTIYYLEVIRVFF